MKTCYPRHTDWNITSNITEYMKQAIFILILLIGLSSIHAQEITIGAPNYDSIAIIIRDSTSSYYYPRLFSRLLQYDTTLNVEEYKILYYGYTFQPEYEPYWRSPYDDKLAKYYQKPDLNEQDQDSLIFYALQSISTNPFDLRQLNSLAYVYHLKGDEETTYRISHRFQGIIAAIMSTGDGMTCQSAFHVISTGHEYVVLNLFQFQFESQLLTSDFCDLLRVKKDQRGIDGIYFSIKRIWDTNAAKMKTMNK